MSAPREHCGCFYCMGFVAKVRDGDELVCVNEYLRRHPAAFKSVLDELRQPDAS